MIFKKLYKQNIFYGIFLYLNYINTFLYTICNCIRLNALKLKYALENFILLSEGGIKVIDTVIDTIDIEFKK